MSDFVNILNQIVYAAKINGKNNGTVWRWKICVALSNNGWKAYSCEKVEESESDEIIVRWRKAGKKDKTIKLTFADQRLWLEYQERNNAQT